MDLKILEATAVALMNEIYPNWVSEKDMQKTPERFAKAMQEWFTPKEFEFTVFDAPIPNQVIEVANIDFHAVCAHHLLPILGTVSIKYICDRHIAGLSKFGRVVEHFSKKPMIQEEFTKNIFEYLADALQPNDLYIRVEAIHTCMTTRGVNKENAVTVTELGFSEGE